MPIDPRDRPVYTTDFRNAIADLDDLTLENTQAHKTHRMRTRTRTKCINKTHKKAQNAQNAQAQKSHAYTCAPSCVRAPLTCAPLRRNEAVEPGLACGAVALSYPGPIAFVAVQYTMFGLAELVKNVALCGEARCGQAGGGSGASGGALLVTASTCGR